MAKAIHCRDGGLVCRAQVERETEEEVVRAAVEHAREAHGVELDRSQTLVRFLRSLVRET